ncbi:MAG: hypothetical protein JXQ91_15335 [Vannielia sp.]|uniref:hypothetical protein n=1 Tax=Vannielia sp. TaxID=2813045 RepID=UPI003B8B2763
MSEKQLTFIASGGRTGTQFFGDVLGEVISDCHSEHEPDMVAGASWLTLQRIRRFGLWHMVLGRFLGQTGVRVIGQRSLEGRITPEQAMARLKALRESYHAGIPESLVIESYYAWWMVADQIPQVWPGARVAGILRDPRDWITSWLRRSSRRRNGALTERLPPGPFEPGRIGDASAARHWPALDQLGRLAWEWGQIAGTLDRAAAASPDVEVFRFEDLFGGNAEALSRFVSFVSTHAHGPAHQVGDLSGVTRDVRNASTGPKQGWQGWSDAQVAAVAHFCGPGMAAHGYGLEPEWQERVRAAGPLAGSEG